MVAGASAETRSANPGSSTTAPGPPTTGLWVAGQSYIDSNGQLWSCVAGGSPGMWTTGGLLGRAELTVGFVPTTVATAITGLSVPVSTPAGADIEVECLLPWVAMGAAAASFVGYLYEDATLLRSSLVSLGINASGQLLTKVDYAPVVSGAHTYTMQIALTVASAGAIVEAGVPAFGALVNPYLSVKVA